MAGIDDMGFFVPPAYISSKEFSRGARLSDGLMEKGLGVRRKSVANRHMDTQAMGMSAFEQVVGRLPEGGKSKIRRIGWGTETADLDSAKPGSSYLLPLMNGAGDRVVEDERTYNVKVSEEKFACLGGLGLLVDYLGKDAVVVASDKAEYDLNGDASAEGTAGAGAAAVVLGEGRLLRVPDEVILDDLAGFSSSHTYDFTKPCCEDGSDFRSSKFPRVDGKFSFLSYLKNVGDAYRDLKERWGGGLDSYRGVAMHVPYPRMAEYALKYIRMIDEGVDGEVRRLVNSVRSFQDEAVDVYAEVKGLLKEFSDSPEYAAACGEDALKLTPSLEYPADVGNCYTASVFMSMASWLENADYSPGDRLLVLGYGSGAGSVAVPFEVTEETAERVKLMGLGKQIHDPGNRQLTFDEYTECRNGGGQPPGYGWIFEGTDGCGKRCYSRAGN